MIDRRFPGIFELSTVWADWDESAQKRILSRTIPVAIRWMESRSCDSRWWFFANTCHVLSAESSKAINAFGSFLSDIARKHFDRAMQNLSYSKYASDIYQSIRIVCPYFRTVHEMPNTTSDMLTSGTNFERDRIFSFVNDSVFKEIFCIFNNCTSGFHWGVTESHSRIERC